MLTDDGRHLIVFIQETSRRKEADACPEEYQRQLEERIRESASKNREQAIQFLLSQEEERQKLGLDLHDTVGQSLTLLMMYLYRLRKLTSEELRATLDDMEKQVREMVGQVRDLSRANSLRDLDEAELVEALRSHFLEVRDRAALTVNFNHRKVPKQLPRVIQITVYRVIQEALTNVIRHAGTDIVNVSLKGAAGTLDLKIEDKGTGFDLGTVTPESMGINNMKRRAALLGGSLVIESSPGRGTCISGTFPLH